MRQTLRFALPAFLITMLALPTGVTGQLYTSIGAGVAAPISDFGDVAGTGYTVRGQVGLSAIIVDAHIQGGWSRFSGEDFTVGGETVSGETANVYHAGVGARLGLGLIWVGANGAYFFGDADEGIGFFPEVGVGIGPIEVVADIRIDGDQKWAAVRAALRF